MAGVQHSSVLSLLVERTRSWNWTARTKCPLEHPRDRKQAWCHLGVERMTLPAWMGMMGTDGHSQSEKPEAADLKELREVEERDPRELVASFSERVQNMSPDKIKIPPEPPGRCSKQLQDKIEKLYERKMKEGIDMNYIIQKKKAFRNPSIQFCSIDEFGTNYPKDMFDPHSCSEDSYYEALAKAQTIEMDKWKKAKKERTKIEFVTGTKKGTTTSAASTTTTTSSTTVGDAQKNRRR